MDSWEERHSQPPDVNRCAICGLTDMCPGHENEEEELKIIDELLNRRTP
jgi:hypothetical protein